MGGRTADPLGCARDDRKERVVARKGRFLNRGVKNLIWTHLKFSRPRGTGPRILRYPSTACRGIIGPSLRDSTLQTAVATPGLERNAPRTKRLWVRSYHDSAVPLRPGVPWDLRFPSTSPNLQLAHRPIRLVDGTVCVRVSVGIRIGDSNPPQRLPCLDAR